MSFCDGYFLREPDLHVKVVWAGTEVPISVMEERMDESGVDWDIVAVGYGIRGSTLEPIVERLEGASQKHQKIVNWLLMSQTTDLVEMYARKAPDARKVFNHSPESLVWSVAHRMAMDEDCAAAGKPGKLIVSDPEAFYSFLEAVLTIRSELRGNLRFPLRS